MERLTVSLDEKMARAVREVARREDLKLSAIVRKALDEYLASRQPQLLGKEPDIHPKVLWRLRGRLHPRGPSMRATKVKVGSFRIVDLSELQLS